MEIFKCVAGSHLFGTSTKASDTDYKAVHIPAARDILLGHTQGVIDRSTGDKSTHNTSEDVDMVSFPIQKFLGMLAKGETNAIEMLHAPNMHDSWYWEQLVEHKFRLIPANMKAFVGFGRSQAMRYAVRGDRVAVLTEMLDKLSAANQSQRLTDYRGLINEIAGLDSVSVVTKRHGETDVDYIVAFGRAVPVNCKVKEVMDVFQKPLDEAGKRTRDAVDGPDWKGMYHAHRVVDEGIEFFSTGNLEFPCRNADQYLAIRNGELPIQQVLDSFDLKLAELEATTPIPAFREKADKEWIDEFVMAVHEQAVVGAYEAWRAETAA